MVVQSQNQWNRCPLIDGPSEVLEFRLRIVIITMICYISISISITTTIDLDWFNDIAKVPNIKGSIVFIIIEIIVCETIDIGVHFKKQKYNHNGFSQQIHYLEVKHVDPYLKMNSHTILQQLVVL